MANQTGSKMRNEEPELNDAANTEQHNEICRMIYEYLQSYQLYTIDALQKQLGITKQSNNQAATNRKESCEKLSRLIERAVAALEESDNYTFDSILDTFFDDNLSRRKSTYWEVQFKSKLYFALAASAADSTSKMSKIKVFDNFVSENKSKLLRTLRTSGVVRYFNLANTPDVHNHQLFAQVLKSDWKTSFVTMLTQILNERIKEKQEPILKKVYGMAINHTRCAKKSEMPTNTTFLDKATMDNKYLKARSQQQGSYKTTAFLQTGKYQNNGQLPTINNNDKKSKIITRPLVIEEIEEIIVNANGATKNGRKDDTFFYKKPIMPHRGEKPVTNGGKDQKLDKYARERRRRHSDDAIQQILDSNKKTINDKSKSTTRSKQQSNPTTDDTTSLKSNNQSDNRTGIEQRLRTETAIIKRRPTRQSASVTSSSSLNDVDQVEQKSEKEQSDLPNTCNYDDDINNQEDRYMLSFNDGDGGIAPITERITIRLPDNGTDPNNYVGAFGSRPKVPRTPPKDGTISSMYKVIVYDNIPTV